METIELILSFVSGGITLPLATWIKAHLPTDFPIQSVVISAILNFVIIYVLTIFVDPNISMKDIITLALGGQFISQLGHSVVKTTSKRG